MRGTMKKHAPEDIFTEAIGDIIKHLKNCIPADQLLEQSSLSLPGDSCIYNKTEKIFEHFMFSTKFYRDYGCAAFKTITAFEKITNNCDEVFIRLMPNIVKETDFSRNYSYFRGVFRISTNQYKPKGQTFFIHGVKGRVGL